MLRRVLLGLSLLAVAAGIVSIALGVRAALGSSAEQKRQDLPPISIGGLTIDAQEVSVGEYAACVRAGACSFHVSASAPTHYDLLERHAESSGCLGGRPDRADHPMNCVDFHQAETYCKWAGKRLLSRDEWEATVGKQEPRRRDDFHRETDRFVWGGEWTSSPAGPKGRAPSPALRWLVAWYDGGQAPDKRFEERAFWRTTTSRYPWLRFRCAR